MKRNKTKSSLLFAVLSLVLCMSMFVGTTYAWFTDSVTSANNIIQSGNLDMKVSFKPYGESYTDWTEITETTKIFDEDAFYEPGYTEAIWVKVENVGSLAFRYDLALDVVAEYSGVNKAGEEFKLSDYLTVMYRVSGSTESEAFYNTRESLVNGFAWGASANSGVASFADDIAFVSNGVALPEGEEGDTSYALLVLHMPTSVGNEANHNGTTVPEIKFALTAMATQLPYEADSFNSGYDASAEYENPEDDGYEIVRIYDLDDFTAFGKAVNDNTNYDGVRVANNNKVWVELMADIDMTDAPAIQGTEFSIGNGNNLIFTGVFDGNGHTLSNYHIAASWQYNVSLFRTVGGNFTMKDVTFDNCSASKPNSREASIIVGTIGGGTITFDNVDIKNSTVNGVYGAAAYAGKATEGAIYFIDCDVDNVTLTSTAASAKNAIFLSSGYSHHDYAESGIYIDNCTVNNCKSTVNGADEATINDHNYVK